MLSAHYRSPLNFSAELMEAAKNSFERITNAVDHLKHLIDTTKTETMTEAEIEQEKKSEEFVVGFEKAWRMILTRRTPSQPSLSL